MDSMQEFIIDNESVDIRDFVLRNREINGVPSPVIADQIAGRKKSKTKLPDFYSTRGIIYPPAGNLEQSSSSLTAGFKTETVLADSGNALAIDLTGGFGVDTFFLSRKFSRVIYVEPNEELLSIARHNHQLLHATNIEYFAQTAEQFSASFTGSADVIFIDPSRRVEQKKIVGLRDSLPDITSLQHALLRMTRFLLVKASPLLDIKSALTELASVSDVFVLSVDNDCKELLFLARKGFANSPTIHGVNIDNRGSQNFFFHYEEEAKAAPAFSQPLHYLYEPNVSILKAGAFKVVAERFMLSKLDQHSHLYTSHEVNVDFPGRIFQVGGIIEADAKAVKRQFPLGKANVIARNYPMSVDEIRARLKIKEGGDEYLIATKSGNKRLLIAAKRLK